MENNLDKIESKMKRLHQLLDIIMQACFAVGIVIGAVMLLLPIIWAADSTNHELMGGYWPYVVCSAIVLVALCTLGQIFIMNKVFKHKKMKKQNKFILEELEIKTNHEYRMAKLTYKGGE